MMIKSKARPPMAPPTFARVEIVVVCESSCESGPIPMEGPEELEVPLDENEANEADEGTIKDPVLVDESDGDIEDDDPLADAEFGVTVADVAAALGRTPVTTFCLGVVTLKLMALV